MNRRILAGFALVIVGIVGAIVYSFDRLAAAIGLLTTYDSASPEHLRAGSV